MASSIHYIAVNKENSSANITLLRRLLVLILLAALLVQVVVSSGVENGILALISYLIAMLVTVYALNRRLVGRSLVSRLILVGGAYSLLGGAIIAKSFEFVEFTSGLRHPLETIVSASLFVAVFLCAHVFYERVSGYISGDSYLVRKVYLRSGLFRAVSSTEILILSAAGISSVLATWMFFLKDFEGSSVARLLSLVSIFYFAPIIFIFYGDRYKRMAVMAPALMVPVCLAIASLTGRRGYFADYALAACGAFLLMFLIGAYGIRRKSLRRLLVVALLSIPVFSAFQIISDAVLSVRNDFHESLNYSDNISAVISAFFSDEPEKSDAVKEELDANEFSEVYTGNFAVDRFVLIKYMDNIVDFDLKAPELKERIWVASINMFNGLVPGFITRIFSLSASESSDQTVMDEARCKALGECGKSYIFGSWLYISKILFGYVGGIFLVFSFTVLIFAIADFAFMKYDSVRGVAFSVPLMLSSANVFWFSLYAPSPMEMIIVYLRFFPRGIIVIFAALLLVRVLRSFFAGRTG